jgi:hypothetical protein
MKSKIKFNHNAENLQQALGVDVHMYAAQLASIIAIASSDEDIEDSEVSEMMHNAVDYKIILYLATMQLGHLITNMIKSESIDLNNLSEN